MTTKKIILETLAGEQVEFDRDALLNASRDPSGFVRVMTNSDGEDENEDEEETPVIQVPIPVATKTNLERIREFSEHHLREPMHTIPAPLHDATLEALSKCDHAASWVEEFARPLRDMRIPPDGKPVSKENLDAYNSLMQTAKFLNITRLIELLTAIIASIIKFKEQEYMVRVYGKMVYDAETNPDGVQIEQIPIEKLREMYPTVLGDKPAPDYWKDTYEEDGSDSSAKPPTPPSVSERL
jgi:hypothetical protein